MVVESSVAVGMTRNVMGPILDRAEADYALGFSPERVDPGRLDPPATAIRPQ
jgi:UDP-N-acetyl-D-mannosaminuronate dehydrogenase